MESRLTPQLLAGSVVAVPPLARRANGTVHPAENQRMIRFLEAGGISTLLYGGNANFYHIGLDEYESTLRMLTDLVTPETTVIPSMGPSWGMMREQASVLREFDFPSAMMLPTRDAITSRGIATGIRKVAESYGKPIILYIKHASGLSPDDSASLVRDGVVAAIKYAIVLEDPTDDPYLSALIEKVSPEIIISGMGEQPAIVHMQSFGLISFTSGCVCVAPAQSQAMLRAIQAGNFDTAETIRQLFKPLEDLRNDINPIRVLHEAVRLSGIAETGPLTPLLSNLETDHHQTVQQATLELLSIERAAV